MSAGIILVGGKSRRFGSDKTVLRWGGTTILEQVAGRLSPIVDEIMLAGATEKFLLPGIREVADVYPDAGPLAGIHAGLCNTKHERIFVTACDMPFFDTETAVRLLELARDYDAAVPREGMVCQPLFAAYNRSVLPEIELMLSGGERSVRILYDRVRVKYLDLAPGQDDMPSGFRFFNINSPEDYQKLLDIRFTKM